MAGKYIVMSRGSANVGRTELSKANQACLDYPDTWLTIFLDMFEDKSWAEVRDRLIQKGCHPSIVPGVIKTNADLIIIFSVPFSTWVCTCLITSSTINFHLFAVNSEQNAITYVFLGPRMPSKWSLEQSQEEVEGLPSLADSDIKDYSTIGRYYERNQSPISRLQHREIGLCYIWRVLTLHVQCNQGLCRELRESTRREVSGRFE